MAADINDNDHGEDIRALIEQIRSEDEDERKSTISKIPTLIVRSLRNNDKIIDQLLLVIYNLNTDTKHYEVLNAGNRSTVIRHLLRLYVDTIDKHEQGQINSLIGLLDLIHSSDILVELAYVLYRCSLLLEDDVDAAAIDRALDMIEDRAAANLHPKALLMIHSIKAMR